MKLYHFQIPVEHLFRKGAEDVFNVFIRSNSSPDKKQLLAAISTIIKQSGSDKNDEQAKEAFDLVSKMREIPRLEGYFVGCSEVVIHPRLGYTTMLISIVSFFDADKLIDDASIVESGPMQQDQPNRFAAKLDL